MLEAISSKQARPAALVASKSPGVNVVGFLRAEFGHGEAARRMISGLEAVGVPYAAVRVKTPHHRERHDVTLPETQASYPTNLVCLNPEHLLEFAHREGRTLLRDRYTVGAWCWEASIFPAALRPALDLVDEIWVASNYVSEIISSETEKPVLTFPMPVEISPATPLSRRDLGLPQDRFVFLFAFDFFSTAERKNPFGLVEAFGRAFPPGTGPLLYLKSINGDRYRDDFNRLRRATDNHPDIVLVDRYLSAGEMRGLVANSDAFVSLHRSEGFGLVLAEAMAHGKPVVATGYSGNLTFMDDQNSYLVGFELTEVPPGLPNYPAGALWAEPDLDDAADAMRRVVESPDEARKRGERGRATIAEHHSVERIGDFLGVRLGELAGRRTTRIAPRSAAERAKRFLSDGPSLDWDLRSPRFGRLGPVARRALLRILRPYLVRQREWEALVVDALLENEERLDGIKRDVENLQDRLERLWDRVDRIDGQLHARPFADTAPPRRGSTYSSFEDVFRGSEERVRGLLRPYVSLLIDQGPVLDVGCGRGEFLDLLRDADVDAVGVDVDEGMVERARAKGHEVELADAIEYLAAQPDERFGAIFAAQVIEHLPFETLLRLFRLAAQKLPPGGLLVVETINPHSVAAFRTFWTDPTHNAPIFPEVAVTLALIEGFGSARVVFPRGTGDPERDAREQTEYAVVATKAS